MGLLGFVICLPDVLDALSNREFRIPDFPFLSNPPPLFRPDLFLLFLSHLYLQEDPLEGKGGKNWRGAVNS